MSPGKRGLVTGVATAEYEAPKQASPALVAKLTAEFVGTFALVFTACNNNASESVLGSISVACSLMVGIYALGSVSGAHFNPAVTLGIHMDSHFFKGSFKGKDLAMYWGVQLLGGLCAGLASGGVWTSPVGGPASGGADVWRWANTTNAHGEVNFVESYKTLGLNIDAGAELGPGIVFVAEAVYTCVLVFVVLNVATCNDTKEKVNQYFGLAIGFVIAAGATTIGSISGCALNPAVSFGVAFNAVPYGADIPFRNFFFYAGAELVGAAVAFSLFAVVRGKHTPNKAIGLVEKAVAEFFGTFVLTLTVCLVVSQGKQAPVVGLIGIASSLMVMIYSLAAVSGANFNPAVTTGLLFLEVRNIDKIALINYCAYVSAQIVGGLFALGVAIFLRQGEWKVDVVSHAAAVGATTTELAMGTWGAIIGAEFFYTLLLVFVVLNVAVRDAGNQYYGLAIGFVIVAGGAAIGGLSGGVFNPAIAFAIDIGSTRVEDSSYGYGWIYIVTQLVAGMCAAGLYCIVNKQPKGENSDDEDVSSDGAVA